MRINIGLMVDVWRAKRDQASMSSLEAMARAACAQAQKAVEGEPESVEKLSGFTHAFPCFGWGGRSKCRNVLVQLLFGSSMKDEWFVFFGPCGLGVLDHNGDFQRYASDKVKKIDANAMDGSMVRVYMRGERYLELHFGDYFSGQHPAKMLNEVVLSKA